MAKLCSDAHASESKDFIALQVALQALAAEREAHQLTALAVTCQIQVPLQRFHRRPRQVIKVA